RRKKEEVTRKKLEGRRKKEEGRRKKEEVRRKKEEVRSYKLAGIAMGILTPTQFFHRRLPLNSTHI
ncbi:MAG: hypothetical protein AAFS12_19715, partial [Cyanobacteria bacterium J06632_19]